MSCGESLGCKYVAKDRSEMYLLKQDVYYKFEIGNRFWTKIFECFSMMHHFIHELLYTQINLKNLDDWDYYPISKFKRIKLILVQLFKIMFIKVSKIPTEKRKHLVDKSHRYRQIHSYYNYGQH